MSRRRMTKTIGATFGVIALATGTLVAVSLSSAGASSSTTSTQQTTAKTKAHPSTPTSGVSAATTTTAASGTVLTVGTYANIKGQYTSIQSAVNAAKPGDWILIAPGDYKESSDLTNWNPTTAKHGGFGGVLITTPDIHLRGLNRSTTVVDGTKPGSPECSSKQADQEFGYVPPGGTAAGRNGIVVYEANNVSIDNLTACNFLSGSQGGGNQIWWNGGADTETINLHGYEGSYLNATSTYFNGEDTAAAYGIFSSDSAGPANWNQIYGSNQNDSGMYVGACKQQCGITINHAWMENNALGYSGTNSGGAIVIENSTFDHNQDGLDTNTQIAGDPPAPQNGDCPGAKTISKVTGTHSCWVAIHNTFKYNNNPDVPEAGSASAGPTGTGMTLSGGRNDTVMDNTFEDNNAWGFLLVPYPDSSTPEDGQSCAKTGGVQSSAFGCVYDPMNDTVKDNTFVHNGRFGNPSNGDLGQIVLNGNQPSNCFIGNSTPDGQGGENLEAKYPKCGIDRVAADTEGVLLGQVLCDTGFAACTSSQHYPKPPSANDPSGVKLQVPAVPADLPTMPNPCAGVPEVPSNLWCKDGALIAS